MLDKIFRFLSAIHSFASAAVSRRTRPQRALSHSLRTSNIGATDADRTSDVTADVLVVEDDEVNQMVIEQMLKILGYQCEIAADGERAVRQVARGKYRMILMDGQMPGMNGIATTREIRQWESDTRAPSTPIFALTADAVQGTQEECSAVGMNGFLRKPITLPKLQSAIESQIGQPRSTCATSPLPGHRTIPAPHCGHIARAEKTPA